MFNMKIERRNKQREYWRRQGAKDEREYMQKVIDKWVDATENGVVKLDYITLDFISKQLSSGGEVLKGVRKGRPYLRPPKPKVGKCVICGDKGIFQIAHCKKGECLCGDCLFKSRRG